MVVEVLDHHGYDVVCRGVIRDEIRIGEQEAFRREGHFAVSLHIRQELVRRGSGLEEIGFADAAVGGDGFGDFPDRIAFGDDQPVRFGLAAGQLVQQGMEAHARIEGILAGMDVPGLAGNGRYGAEPQGAGDIALIGQDIADFGSRHVAADMDVAALIGQEEIRAEIAISHGSGAKADEAGQDGNYTAAFLFAGNASSLMKLCRCLFLLFHRLSYFCAAQVRLCWAFSSL